MLSRPISSLQGMWKLLEDTRLLLGLTPEELVATIALLEKTDCGSLWFTRGNRDIRFQSTRSDRSCYSDISLELETKEEDYTSTIKYNLPRTLLRLVKRKNPMPDEKTIRQ